MGQLGKDGYLSTNIDFDTAQSLFATGKVPYYVTGPWAVDKAKGAGIKYAISPLPTIEGKKMQPFLGVQMFYVSAKAKNDAFAQEFVTNYVPKKELQVDLFAAGHRPPALKAAYARGRDVGPRRQGVVRGRRGRSADAEHPGDELGLGPAGSGDG